MSSTVNAPLAEKFMAWCRSQRVAVTGFFNSNGLRGGYGVVEALQQSFISAGIKIFAAGPVAVSSTSSATNADDGNTSYRSNNSCLGWNRVVTSGSGANTLLNASNIGTLTAYEAKVMSYGRANDGSGTEYPALYRALHLTNVSLVNAAGAACGVTFTATATNSLHIDPTKVLRSDHWYANRTTAGGAFRPAAIQGSLPNIAVAAYGSSVVVPAGTADAFVRVSWDVPAGTRDTQIRVGHCNSLNTPTGEVTFGYQVTWERDALTGVLVAPMISMGGWSMYDFANLLFRTDGSQLYDEAIDHWIDVVTRPTIDAGQEATALWMLVEGSNQASEGTASISGYAATSVAAFVDNASYIIRRVLARWVTKGFDANRLIFGVCPDHPNTSNESIRLQYGDSGLAQLQATFPSNVLGFNANDRFTVDQLMNVGLGNASYYSIPSGGNTPSNIATTAAGADVVITVVNSYTTPGYIDVKSTNCTPNINGVHPIKSRNGTSVTIAAPSPLSRSLALAILAWSSRLIRHTWR